MIVIGMIRVLLFPKQFLSRKVKERLWVINTTQNTKTLLGGQGGFKKEYTVQSLHRSSSTIEHPVCWLACRTNLYIKMNAKQKLNLEQQRITNITNSKLWTSYKVTQERITFYQALGNMELGRQDGFYWEFYLNVFSIKVE